MTQLVSILIPAYNAGEWIAETIESALAQTWPRKEIIVVNDGSADDTLAIARQFASGEVSVVTQDNQGAAAARNKAFSLSQGDYIQWLDADDLLSPDKISRQMQARERWGTERTLFSCGWGYFMYRPQRAQFTASPLWADLSPVEWLTRKLEHNTHMQTGTWLVSRTLTEAAGPWNRRLLGDDDGEYFCRVLRASDGVRFVREGRVFYRMSSGARLSYIGRSQPKLEAHFISMRLHIDYLLALEDSARTRAACVNYLQTWLHHFYPDRQEIISEAQRLAKGCGGRLEVPRLSWKYEWMRRLIGWRQAMQVQASSRALKWALLRSYDRLLFRLERLQGARRAAICRTL
jgi:glycosyltransferase involved in cell wall biosynthesis